MNHYLNRSFCCVLLFCLANIAQAQNGPNLLANPSFEQPALAPGTAADITPTDWGLLNGLPAIITAGYTGGAPAGATNFWPQPTDGNQYLYVGDSLTATTVYQDVTLAAATNYRLTFDEANFLSQYGNNGARLLVDVLNNGQSILGNPAVFTRPNISGFAAQELDFTSLNAGTYRLSLDQPGGYGTNVDNFSLTVNSAASVPEASTLMILLIGGVSSIGVFSRSRRGMR